MSEASTEYVPWFASDGENRVIVWAKNMDSARGMARTYLSGGVMFLSRACKWDLKIAQERGYHHYHPQSYYHHKKYA